MWNLILSDDLKFWSFFKMKHWICKESTHFLKLILFNNDFFFESIGEHLNIYLKKLQKNSFKNSFSYKSFFGKKNMLSFSKVIFLAPSYMFWP